MSNLDNVYQNRSLLEVQMNNISRNLDFLATISFGRLSHKSRCANQRTPIYAKRVPLLIEIKEPTIFTIFFFEGSLSTLLINRIKLS